MPEMIFSIPLDHTFLAYLFGGIGIVCEWRAYWHQSDNRFRRWSAVGALFWAAQYFLLAANTAALTMACTALRTLASQPLQASRYRHLAAVAFITLFVALTALSWQGWVSLLPAFAVINTTLALFYLHRRRLRLTLLASSAAWIANDIFWQAWPAFLAESVAAVINIRTIQRIDGDGGNR